MSLGRSIRSFKPIGSVAKFSSQAMVKPPVPMFGVDGRYALALYSAASKKNKLEQVDKNLKTLLDLQKKDAKFRDFLINPLVKSAQKRDILSRTFSKMEMDDLTLNLIAVLSENGRMKYLGGVARTFNRAMSHVRGELNVKVTASSPLDEQSTKELNDVLQQFGKGKILMVNMNIDKSILGGLIIDFNGEHYIDMSIKKKFNQYANLLRQPV